MRSSVIQVQWMPFFLLIAQPTVNLSKNWRNAINHE